jgi:hypothetical protein
MTTFYRKKPKQRLWSLLLMVIITMTVCGMANTADAKKKNKKRKAKSKVESTVFGISPPIINLDCAPGERVATEILVDNPGNDAMSFELMPVGLISLGKKGLASRPVSTLPPDNFARHLTMEKEQVRVPKRSQKKIGIFINVPANAKGTQYTGVAIANTSSSSDNSGIRREEEYKVEVGLGMQPGIGVTIKCNITGTMQYAYELVSVKIHPRKGNKPISAEVILRNSGNGETRIYPTLVLLNNKKSVIARFQASERVNISPGETKEVKFKPSFKKIPPGSYVAIVTVADPKYKLRPLEKRGVVVR